MGEIERSAEETRVSTLDNLAAEARIYSESLAMNMFQLGRVLTEAKKLVQHGEWREWIRKCGGMSERSAQQLMAVYARFGNNPVFTGIEKSKLFKMLSLPAGSEGAFLDENDVTDMTTRAVEEAVRKAREEAEAVIERVRTEAMEGVQRAQEEARASAQEEIAREREARELAEKRVTVLEETPPEIPEDVSAKIRDQALEIEKFKADLVRTVDAANEAIRDRANAVQELSTARNDVKELEGLLTEKQVDFDALQEKYLNAQSNAAKGEIMGQERDEMTLSALSAAVRRFMGEAARVPQMGGAFAVMHQSDRNEYAILIQTVEAWVEGARRALDKPEGGELYV